MKHNAQNGISCIYPMAFSSEDAARMLGVSTKTLANWRCSGKGGYRTKSVSASEVSTQVGTSFSSV